MAQGIDSPFRGFVTASLSGFSCSIDPQHPNPFPASPQGHTSPATGFSSSRRSGLQGFLRAGRPSLEHFQTAAQRCGIDVVGRDDRCAPIIIACVEDMPHRVPYPLARLGGTKLVQYQDLSFKDRRKDVELRDLHLAIVAVLDLLQQIAIIRRRAQ
jgi:hypothetical protein